MDKVEFKVEIGGVEKELAVKRPTKKDMNEATIVYHKALKEALDKNVMLRVKIESYLREQDIWNDKKELEYSNLQQVILDGKRRLDGGNMKLSEAREVALNIADARAKVRNLIAEKVQLDNFSAEGLAENAQFDCLVACCTVYNLTGERVFKSYDDFIEKAYEPWVITAASHLSKMMYNLDSNHDKKLPENQFLVKFKFMDDELRLINKEGKLVDRTGRLIDEEGRFIDAEGNYVDINGHPIDKAGNYVQEHKPFLDDDGNPIVEEAVTPEAEVVTEETKD